MGIRRAAILVLVRMRAVALQRAGLLDPDRSEFHDRLPGFWPFALLVKAQDDSIFKGTLPLE